MMVNAINTVVCFIAGVVLVAFAEPLGRKQLIDAAEQNKRFMEKHPRVGKYLVPTIEVNDKTLKRNIQATRFVGIGAIGLGLFGVYTLLR